MYTSHKFYESLFKHMYIFHIDYLIETVAFLPLSASDEKLRLVLQMIIALNY